MKGAAMSPLPARRGGIVMEGRVNLPTPGVYPVKFYAQKKRRTMWVTVR